MKRNLKFLLLSPFLMAILCEPEEDICGIDNPESYIVNVENNAESYEQNETIWLNARTTSMLIDSCTDLQEPELITDAEVFLDGLFVLKLNNSSMLNAQIFNDAEVIYDIGEAYSFNSCSNAINCLPELTDDNQFYQYRLGISVNTPGDYCIVNARDSYFNLEQENNANIFSSYNTLEDRIRFQNCGDTYTRNGTDGFYFFSIN